jgi:hypothetical protein
MQVKNIQLYKGIDFEAYQGKEGHSYSSIKNSDSDTFKQTFKMQLGTEVHNYLLEPKTYQHERRELIVPIAQAAYDVIGQALPFLDTELSVTADFEHEGFTMGYRGRVDMVRSGKVVVDLKISEMPLAKSIPYFGYDKQLTGYCLATMCKVGIIIRVNPKTRHTERVVIKQDVAWWEEQVLKLGIPTEFY